MGFTWKQEKLQGHWTHTVVLPPLRVQNIWWSLKIRALACVAKDTRNISLAEQNWRSGASDHEKTRKPPGALDPSVFPPPLWVQNTLRSLKI